MDKLFVRRVEGALTHLLTYFPAVGLIGPRQVGKTTLARALEGDFVYLDLEDDRDRVKLAHDPHFFFDQFKEKCVVLDEVQRMPEVFAILRGVIDAQRSGGLQGPCINAYFVINHPIHDTIDKYTIGLWVDEIFSRNGLDNISSSVTNDDGAFREWHDLWVETKYHFPGPLGLTDITTSPWKFYRKHREKSGYPGGTYVVVP